MATTSIVDKTACEAAGQGQEAGLLPVNPYTALQFHFGMLLGVDDLETGQAYPRGKMRLHNAWLHGQGVVWGLDVAFNARNELRVSPGLALDAAGHELHLDRPACLDLGQWYGENKDSSDFSFQTDESSATFSVRVVARFKACLTRPVPAIVEPCEGTQTDTAYSRVFETVELLLRPLPSEPSAPRDPGYHRLRLLFRIEDDPEGKYPEVQVCRQGIEALPSVQQPAAYLDALRRFAAFDVIDLKPRQATDTEPASIFPEDPTEVVLADIKEIVVEQTQAGGWSIAETPPRPDVTVRPSHIPTATIQELLCGPLFTRPLSVFAGPTVTDAQWDGATVIEILISRDIAGDTITVGAFAVSVIDYGNDQGWVEAEIDTVTPDTDSSSIQIQLKNSPAGDYLRLVVKGTGATPLRAADDSRPLGSLQADPDTGVDYLKIFKLK